MSAHSALERFLLTDPRDIGCEQALAVLHIYADLVLEEPSGRRAALRYPGLEAHLLACGPCAQDLEGLLITIGGAATT